MLSCRSSRHSRATSRRSSSTRPRGTATQISSDSSSARAPSAIRHAPLTRPATVYPPYMSNSRSVIPASGTAKGVVVHCHGNAANVTGHVVLVSWLPAAGYHVLMFDYRGYGKSEGRVTRAGTILDAHAALDYARTRPEAAGLPVFLYGQSLGGAVAIVVAADRPEVAAVVAESTFSSHRGIAARHVRRLVHFDWLARLLATISISGGYDPIDVVARLSPRPLFVIAAEHDQICFPELARELYDAAREPKSFWLAPGAEHLAILEEHPRELADRITQFFVQAAGRQARD